MSRDHEPESPRLPFHLPNEIFSTIFQFLDPVDLLRLSWSCRLFRLLTVPSLSPEAQYLWEQIVIFPPLDSLSLSPKPWDEEVADRGDTMYQNRLRREAAGDRLQFTIMTDSVAGEGEEEEELDSSPLDARFDSSRDALLDLFRRRRAIEQFVAECASCSGRKVLSLSKRQLKLARICWLLLPSVILLSSILSSIMLLSCLFVKHFAGEWENVRYVCFVIYGLGLLVGGICPCVALVVSGSYTCFYDECYRGWRLRRRVRQVHRIAELLEDKRYRREVLDFKWSVGNSGAITRRFEKEFRKYRVSLSNDHVQVWDGYESNRAYVYAPIMHAVSFILLLFPFAVSTGLIDLVTSDYASGVACAFAASGFAIVLGIWCVYGIHICVQGLVRPGKFPVPYLGFAPLYILGIVCVWWGGFAIFVVVASFGGSVRWISIVPLGLGFVGSLVGSLVCVARRRFFPGACRCRAVEDEDPCESEGMKFLMYLPLAVVAMACPSVVGGIIFAAGAWSWIAVLVATASSLCLVGLAIGLIWWVIAFVLADW